MEAVTIEAQVKTVLKRLELGEVRIHHFRGADLVAAAAPQEVTNKVEAIREASGGTVLGDLAVSEILRVSRLAPRDTFGKSYEVGLRDAALVTSFTNLYDIFVVLTDNHPKAQELTWNYFAVDLAQKGTSAKGFQIDVASMLSPEERKKLPPQFSNSEADRLSEPYVIIAQDFHAIGEKISASRINFLAPVIPILANKHEQTRRSLLQKIIEGTFPFAQYSKDDWISEITSAD